MNLVRIAIMILSVIQLYTLFNISAWRKEKVIGWDVVSYYSYLPSIFIYDDIGNKNPETPNTGWHWPTKDGNRVVKMSMGVAICCAPAFFVVHGWQKLTGGNTGGWSIPYHFAVAISNWLFVLLGLFFLAKTLELRFSPQVTISTLVVIFLGTNLFYYSTSEPGMSHGFSFSLIAAYIYYIVRWHNNPRLMVAAIIGFLFGLITLIRPVNLIVFLLFAFYGVSDWKSFVSQWRNKVRNMKHLIVFVIMFAIAVFPQMLYWKEVTGNWLFYSYIGEHFFWNDPKILEGLFSFRKGWLLYTPVMAFAVAGLFFMRKKFPELKLAMVLLLLLFIYVTFSWWSWWYGGSYGMRPMIDIYAVLALPLASFMGVLLEKSKRIRMITYTLAFCFVSLSLFQTLQYRYNILHYDSTSRDLYLKSYFRLKKSTDFEQLLAPPDYDAARQGTR
ncbi:MAG: hypothetical protein KKA07_00350 [Bacteroidetes bacterium]|nr:hypothetical protein [Bacteroidota bacterium]MBU1717501.1 hypothetical protein [Bacteroidota bacterium]